MQSLRVIDGVLDKVYEIGFGGLSLSERNTIDRVIRDHPSDILKEVVIQTKDEFVMIGLLYMKLYVIYNNERGVVQGFMGSLYDTLYKHYERFEDHRIVTSMMFLLDNINSGKIQVVSTILDSNHELIYHLFCVSNEYPVGVLDDLYALVSGEEFSEHSFGNQSMLFTSKRRAANHGDGSNVLSFDGDVRYFALRASNKRLYTSQEKEYKEQMDRAGYEHTHLPYGKVLQEIYRYGDLGYSVCYFCKTQVARWDKRCRCVGCGIVACSYACYQSYRVHHVEECASILHGTHIENVRYYI